MPTKLPGKRGRLLRLLPGSISILALAVMLLAVVSSAHAGAVVLLQSGNLSNPSVGGTGLFDVNGTFMNSNSLTGTISIDTYTGLPYNSTLVYGGNSYSTLGFVSYFESYTITFFGYQSKQGWDYLNLVFDTPSFVGYDGGSLCGTVGNCPITNPDGIYVSDWTGYTSTPEPGTLYLFGSSLLGLSGFARRKIFP